MRIRALGRCLRASALTCILLLGAGPALAQTTRPEPAQADQLTPEELKARSERFQARVDEAARALELDHVLALLVGEFLEPGIVVVGARGFVHPRLKSRRKNSR